MTHTKERSAANGFSLVEALLALVIFAICAVSVSLYVLSASRAQQAGRTDTRVWSAVHTKFEEILADGYASLSSGADTVQGYPMTWTVSGSDPKKLFLYVSVSRSDGTTRPDTFVTYVAKP